MHRYDGEMADTVDELDVCCPDPGPSLLEVNVATRLGEMFKALADPTRVRLLAYLAASESGTACACHLPAALGISQPTMSFHMRKLVDAGLVSREKRGRWMHYAVLPEALDDLRGYLQARSEALAGRSGCC